MRKLGVGTAAVFGLVATLLAACGGGTIAGDDSGGGGGGTPVPVVSAINLLASSSQLPSDADTSDEGVQIIATVVDASNNIISGVPVQFAVDNQGVLAVTQATTDNSGSAFATLTTPSNRSNRDLTVRSSVGSVSSAIVVSVTGTTLAVVGPSSLAVGQTGRYVATLQDAGGAGIGGVPVSISSSARNTAQPASAVTRNADGTATFDVTVVNGVNDRLTFSAAGVSFGLDVVVSNDQFRITAPTSQAELRLNRDVPVTVEWLRGGTADETAGRTVNLSATRGTLAPAAVVLDANGRGTANLRSGDAGAVLLEASTNELTKPSVSTTAEFVAADADQVDVQFDPQVIPPSGQSNVIVTVRDAAGNLVKNVKVNFTLTDPTNGSLSAGTAVTSSQGRASVVYRATSSQSSNEGVRVRATVASTLGAGVGNSDTATATVAGRALRIVLGTGNELMERNATQYQQPYAVIVTDSAGNAVANAQARLEVLSTRYYKGFYEAAPEGETPPWRRMQTTPDGCVSEDIDDDGLFNADIDFDENTNGFLEPGNVAGVPSMVTLDEFGSAEFFVTYPQDHATWVDVTLKATVQVSGSENTAVARFRLRVLADDVNDAEVPPPGFISPFGFSANCSDDETGKND